MRILLDTNVLVRAIIRPQGPARELLRLILAEQHTLVASPFLLSELLRVLSYPRVRAQTSLTDDEIQEMIASINDVAEIVELEAAPEALSTDPDDNPILQTAALANVDVLCTLDRHFRQADVHVFCGLHSIRILGDVELLKELQIVSKMNELPGDEKREE